MQDPPLLTSKNTNRKERPEVALIMFMAACYLLACRTSVDRCARMVRACQEQWHHHQGL